MNALRGQTPDVTSALAEIRRIYFATTRDTIEGDFAHAIALLKSLPSEEDRERASVFMEGLNEMRRDWQKRAARAPKPTARPTVTPPARTAGARPQPAQVRKPASGRKRR
jgi:hypothetical protein